VICPQCRAEYVPGVTVCFDCGVDLADALAPPEPTKDRSDAEPRRPGHAEPAASPPERFSLVTVLVTSDAGLMAIAQTILESAKIPLVVEGHTHAALFGPGPISGYLPGHPAALRVAAQDADDARGLLTELIADVEGHRREKG
jgi:Putative prokaryotic signal transducing protein